MATLESATNETTLVLYLSEHIDVLLIPSSKQRSPGGGLDGLSDAVKRDNLEFDGGKFEVWRDERWPRVRCSVRDRYCNSKWSQFDQLLRVIPPGGSLGLDDKCFCLLRSRSDGEEGRLHRFDVGESQVEFRDPRVNPRCAVESQLFELRQRLEAHAVSRLILVFDTPSETLHTLPLIAEKILGVPVSRRTLYEANDEAETQISGCESDTTDVHGQGVDPPSPPLTPLTTDTKDKVSVPLSAPAASSTTLEAVIVSGNLGGLYSPHRPVLNANDEASEEDQGSGACSVALLPRLLELAGEIHTEANSTSVPKVKIDWEVITYGAMFTEWQRLRKMLASASVPDRAAMPVVDQLGVPNPVELTPSSAIGPSPLRQCVTNEPSPSPPPSLSSGSSSSQEGNSKEQGLTVQEETSYIS